MPLIELFNPSSPLRSGHVALSSSGGRGTFWDSPISKKNQHRREDEPHNGSMMRGSSTKADGAIDLRVRIRQTVFHEQTEIRSAWSSQKPQPSVRVPLAVLLHRTLEPPPAVGI